MSVESFIAKRYLISKHRINFITIISYLSISGITIGVAALIVVLSVFNGFSDLVTSYFTSFDPHIRIETKDDSAQNIIDNPTKIFNKYSIPAFTPFLSSKVLAIQGNLTQVVELKGIEFPAALSVYGLKENLVLGSINSETKDSDSKIYIGIQLADKLQSVVGDTIILISPSGIERSILNLSLPQMKKFVIGGIFHTNNQEYDAQLIFASIQSVQKLLKLNSYIQGFELRLDNINNSENYKQIFQKALDKEHFDVLTWYDLHKNLYSVMKIERWTAYLILSLIIAVAVFNILGSLTMSVIEKKRDIGLLKSLGLREKSVIKIFLFQGLYVGLIGTLGGFALGLLVYYLQITYNLYPLDPTQYKIDSLPMNIRISDFFAVGAASFILSLLAAIYPALKASKINPIEAIKWE